METDDEDNDIIDLCDDTECRDEEDFLTSSSFVAACVGFL
jgi:hypothetical protein